MTSTDSPPDPSADPSPRELWRRFFSDQGLRAVTANSLWLVADRILGIVLTVVVTAVVVRSLGPARYGVWAHALAVVGLLAPFAQLGIDGIAVRELVRHPEQRAEILGTALGILLIAGVALIPLSVAAAGLATGGDGRAMVTIAILALQFVFQATAAIDFWFRSALRSKYTVLSSRIGAIAGSLVTLALVLSGMPLPFLAVAVVLEAAIAAIFLLHYYRASGETLSTLRFRGTRAWELLRAGLPLFIGIFAGAVYTRIDFIMLRELSTVREVGIYSAAVRLSEVWYFVPMAFALSLFPSVVRMRGTEQGRRRMQQLYDLAAMGGYAVAIPVMLLAKPLVYVIFGADYAAAAPILAVHIWTFGLISLGIMRNNWLVAEDLAGVYMVAAVVGAVFNVVADLILVPRYGGLGAAWASVGAQAMIVFGGSLLHRRAWRTFGQMVLALAAPVRWLATLFTGRAVAK